jgi:hypothetical protein
MSVGNVGNTLVKDLCSYNTIKFTLETGLLSVVNVGNSLLTFQVSKSIREFILVQGLSAVNVRNPLLENIASLNIGKFILEKGLLSASNVGNTLSIILASLNTRKSTGKIQSVCLLSDKCAKGLISLHTGKFTLEKSL